ncbi:hypothetical protein Leryth_019595 [Lithospermum erythrorhizon]|nr:hypothetical protein Leryth_019595 [Lithospermum erythrorhizon]
MTIFLTNKSPVEEIKNRDFQIFLEAELSQRKAQITAYVEFFAQFTSEQFPEDIAELIQSRYPSKEKLLFDDVLATFVLHHPEHGNSVILPII